MEEDRVQQDEKQFGETRATFLSHRLVEGLERLQQMEKKCKRDFESNEREFKRQIKLFKWMEEEQLAYAQEHDCMKREVAELRLEVQQLQAASKSAVGIDEDPGSGWISVRRKPLAPITSRINIHTNDSKLGVRKGDKYGTTQVMMGVNKQRPTGIDLQTVLAGVGPKVEPSSFTGKKKMVDPSNKPPFKFVEPVRKKADRENLQGSTCHLCNKFYDAVLEGNAKGITESRCNHVDNSRHRYRHLPPATPEGFWNIGFDTEI